MKNRLGLLVLNVILLLTLTQCGGDGIAVGNPNTDSNSITGQELRVTPSSGQGITILFEFEFLEDTQVLVTILEKADTSNQLDEQTISYTRTDDVVEFSVTHEQETYDFMITLSDSGAFSTVDVTRDNDDIAISFTDISDES